MRKNIFFGQKKELTLDEMIKRGIITSKTFDRVSIVKSYIEKKYCLKNQIADEKNKGTLNFIKLILFLYRLGTYQQKIRQFEFKRRAKRSIASKFFAYTGGANASRKKKNEYKGIRAFNNNRKGRFW